MTFLAVLVVPLTTLLPGATALNSVPTRLSIMMFLQFFTWGAWFVTLGQCLGENGLAAFIGPAFAKAPIAAIIAPLFLGLIADRFFASQILMGILMLIGGGFLWLAPGYATTGNGAQLVWVSFFGHLLCFMPTLGLSNTITFANVSDPNHFPRIRVWGTIGWIAAGLFVGFQGWSASFDIFRLAAGCSILLGLYCFTLPHTPPPAKGKPVDVRTVFMLDAFRLLGNAPFFVFILCSTLICIPLAYYYSNTAPFLGQIGFEQPASTMTLGQMSEIFFMLLVPFFFRRLGVKWMILVGMAAWVLRYLLFAFGAPEQVIWMLLAAILLHGVCYDFFFVTGFMYTDAKAPADVKGQAQSMLVFFTQGVGMFFGYWVADLRFAQVKPHYEQLTAAIAEARPSQTLSFGESLTRMFSVSLPEGIDAELLSTTMAAWKQFWLLPAGMAAVILVLFALLFRDSETEAKVEAMTDEV
jgi:nucleoside transporter